MLLFAHFDWLITQALVLRMRPSKKCDLETGVCCGLGQEGWNYSGFIVHGVMVKLLGQFSLILLTNFGKFRFLIMKLM